MYFSSVPNAIAAAGSIAGAAATSVVEGVFTYRDIKKQKRLRERGLITEEDYEMWRKARLENCGWTCGINLGIMSGIGLWLFFFPPGEWRRLIISMVVILILVTIITSNYYDS